MGGVLAAGAAGGRLGGHMQGAFQARAPRPPAFCTSTATTPGWPGGLARLQAAASRVKRGAQRLAAALLWPGSMREHQRCRICSHGGRQHG